MNTFSLLLAGLILSHAGLSAQEVCKVKDSKTFLYEGSQHVTATLALHRDGSLKGQLHYENDHCLSEFTAYVEVRLKDASGKTLELHVSDARTQAAKSSGKAVWSRFDFSSKSVIDSKKVSSIEVKAKLWTKKYQGSSKAITPTVTLNRKGRNK